MCSEYENGTENEGKICQCWSIKGQNKNILHITTWEERCIYLYHVVASDISHILIYQCDVPSQNKIKIIDLML